MESPPAERRPARQARRTRPTRHIVDTNPTSVLVAEPGLPVDRHSGNCTIEINPELFEVVGMDQFLVVECRPFLHCPVGDHLGEHDAHDDRARVAGGGGQTDDARRRETVDQFVDRRAVCGSRPLARAQGSLQLGTQPAAASMGCSPYNVFVFIANQFRRNTRNAVERFAKGKRAIGRRPHWFAAPMGTNSLERARRTPCQ